jgi:integrase
VKECLDAKRKDGLSKRYLRQLGYDLDRFKGRFKNFIGDVSGVMIDEWLRSLELAPRTRNNLRASFQTLFSFAKAKRYLPKDNDEIAAVSVAKDNDGEIGIFRPGELRELLLMAKPELVPALVIGAFAGVRHEEILRLDWQDIKLKAGIIEIRAAKAKTASRRTIPIVPNLKAWLKAIPGGQSLRTATKSGPVCPFLDFTRQLLKLAAAVHAARVRAGRVTKVLADGHQKGGFKWQHNGLRHSFISYRVAAVKNVAQVSLEAGNSPQMIFQHYRELVTPQDARAWFAITPETIKAIRRKVRADERRRRAKIVAFPIKAAA